jgi:hypothetical protein
VIRNLIRTLSVAPGSFASLASPPAVLVTSIVRGRRVSLGQGTSPNSKFCCSLSSPRCEGSPVSRPAASVVSSSWATMKTLILYVGAFGNRFENSTKGPGPAAPGKNGIPIVPSAGIRSTRSISSTKVILAHPFRAIMRVIQPRTTESQRRRGTSAPALVTTGAGAPSRAVTCCSRASDWQ